ncbi:unnamed protein product, partial [Porites evermanni]
MDCPEQVAYYILHLLDDFLIISPSNEACQHQLGTFLMLLLPSTTLAFAGIELVTVLMGAHLPQEKLDKCRDLLSTFLCRHKVTHQEIQSLIGFLSFACAVVGPGQAFLHRLIDLIIGVRKPHSLIRLSKEVKEDRLVWQLFHSGFNGHSL